MASKIFSPCTLLSNMKFVFVSMVYGGQLHSIEGGGGGSDIGLIRAHEGVVAVISPYDAD